MLGYRQQDLQCFVGDAAGSMPVELVLIEFGGVDCVAHEHIAGGRVQQDARHVAAQEERRAFRDRISADAGEAEDIAHGKRRQIGLAHQYVRGGAQAAAKHDVFRIPLRMVFAGEVQDVRHAHAHVAAQVVDVVHAAVQNGIAAALVRLCIRHGGEIIAAFGDKETAHFYRQIKAFAQSDEIRRKLADGDEGIRAVFMDEVGIIKTGTVLELFNLKAVFGLERVAQGDDFRNLLALLGQLLALGAGEVVDADDIKVRRGFPALDGGAQIASSMPNCVPAVSLRST